MRRTTLVKVRKRRPGADPEKAPPADATGVALAAMERIRAILVRKGRVDQLGNPATMRELAIRGSYFGVVSLPPSYSAALRVASRIGEPERLLTGTEMRRAFEDVIAPRSARRDASRLAPFAKVGERAFACFDRTASGSGADELPVLEWDDGDVRPRARHFGEWLVAVAEEREEALANAADIPDGVRTLLDDLGFVFDDPAVGRLETGDVEAIEVLLGPERARDVRGDTGRLFDSSRRATLTLNLDEFTLAVGLRTGFYVFEPEDVFRWLRWFRDESLYGRTPARSRSRAHVDRARDLRVAPQEPPLIQQGVLEVACLPAVRHRFRTAAGRSAADFYLLGRTSSTSSRSPSLLLHVVEGEVQAGHSLDEPLTHLHVTPDGEVWALSQTGSALRFANGAARAFPLKRSGRRPVRWHGIGGLGARVIVWGAGALLEFSGDRFIPFAPAPELEETETVVAVAAHGRQLAMLVCGDARGAVARFDGRKWPPIPESDVLDGHLVDLDMWRGIGLVLGRSGEVWRVTHGSPEPVVWDTRQPAFLDDAGAPRAAHAVRGFDGGTLVASDGGVIAVGSAGGPAEPVFHAAAGTTEAARLSRLGVAGGAGRADGAPGPGPGLVATCAGNAWIWGYRRDGSSPRDAFWVIDTQDW